MKRLLKIQPSVYTLMLLAVMLFSLSCNSSNTDCNPADGVPPNCDDIEPTTGVLSMDLTVNTENPFVPIAVYYGYVDDSVLYFQDTIGSKSVSYDVPIGQRYTVVAKYAMQGRTVYAIDGGKVKLKTNDNCGYTCYTTVDLDLNLQLAN